MKLRQRINFLSALGKYLCSGEPAWETAKQQAEFRNGWFTREFSQTAATQIAESMLQPAILEAFVARYPVADAPASAKTVGLVLAGNIPMAGFHDLLCGYLSGHRLLIKTAEKDQVLMEHIVQQLAAFDPEVNDRIGFAPLLRNCDAYIATGSNNSARYFDYYFGKYPHIIRHSRTAAAVLEGNETPEELEKLADDVHLYFGLGCRNVTRLFVPEGYDFVPLLQAFSKYDYFQDHNKFRNNYDYQLSLLILNNQFYMTNKTIILTKNEALFSPVSQVYYSFYPAGNVPGNFDAAFPGQLQCVVGRTGVPFGQAQFPAIDDFADGADTLRFLTGLY